MFYKHSAGSCHHRTNRPHATVNITFVAYQFSVELLDRVPQLGPETEAPNTFDCPSESDMHIDSFFPQSTASGNGRHLGHAAVHVDGGTSLPLLALLFSCFFHYVMLPGYKRNWRILKSPRGRERE